MNSGEIYGSPHAPAKGVFTHDLVPSQHREHLFHFADTDNPLQNYFIRDLGWRLESLNTGPQSIQNIYNKTVTLLSDIQQHDIQVPPYYLQEGLNNDNQPALYLLTRDLGTSVNMGNIKYDQLSNEEQDLFMQRFNALIANLTGYFAECIQQDRDFLSDLAKSEQYVYAPNPPAHDPDFILVDLEPLTVSSHDLAAIDMIVYRLASIVGGVMQKDSVRDLSPSRYAIAMFIDTILNNFTPKDEAELKLLRGLAELRQQIVY